MPPIKRSQNNGKSKEQSDSLQNSTNRGTKNSLSLSQPTPVNIEKRIKNLY